MNKVRGNSPSALQFKANMQEIRDRYRELPVRYRTAVRLREETKGENFYFRAPATRELREKQLRYLMDKEYWAVRVIYKGADKKRETTNWMRLTEGNLSHITEAYMSDSFSYSAEGPVYTSADAIYLAAVKA